MIIDSDQQAHPIELARTNRWFIFVLSVAIIVPCLWHGHIEAGDLGSHVYNAWLAQLIEKGQAPGLYIVRQWDNVLVDWALLHCGNVLGFGAAEKIVTSVCVFIFFWGVFAFVAAVSERLPWFLAPCIAMLAYGYSFSMGFLNYYVSIGLACWSLAAVWRGRGLARLVGVAILPLVILAHPLGLAWLLATGTYIGLSELLRGWWRLAVPAAAVLLLLSVHWYLAHRVSFAVDWEHDPFYAMNGADQLALYSPRYSVLAWVTFGFATVCIVAEAGSRFREKSFWESLRLLAELYALAILAVALLPENLRPSETGAWIGLLASRLTTFTAIFGVSLLSRLKPRWWHLAAFGSCAIVFFSFLCQDTKVLNRMEANVESIVAPLPPCTRVLSTIWAPPGSRITFVSHFVDRACIGHCFSYGNYEPSSGQFRIRVREGSPVVSASEDDSEDMQAGQYDVQDEDLPMKEIFQCDPSDLTKLCIRDLAAGEKNGRLGYRPPAD